MSRCTHPLLHTLLALTFAGLSLGAAAQGKSQTDYESRLGSVNALTTALNADPKAPSSEVQATLATVAARKKEAADLAAVGEFETARLILDEGYRTLTKTLASLKSGTGYSGASGSAAAPSVAETDPARAAAQFDNRLASTRALRDTLKRLDAEKGHRQAAVLASADAKIAQAESRRSADAVSALALLDDAYNAIKLALQQSQGGNTSGLKSGSAALESAQHGGNLSGEAQQAEIDRQIKSVNLLRDSLLRMARERNADVSETLTRIDTLSQLAQQQRPSNPAGALQAASEANSLAKAALAKLRS